MIGRVVLLALCFAAFAAIAIGRLAQLQLVRGTYYANEIHDDRLMTTVLPARRGRILDREGRPLADNRAVYHVAVVMKDLELPRRERRRTTFYRFGQEHLDALVADLSLRLARPLEATRRDLMDELLLNPGVAIRHGERRESLSLGLLAIPRSAMVMAEDDASEGTDPRWYALAESGLLHSDPRKALAAEYRLRRERGTTMFDAGQLDWFFDHLQQLLDVPKEHLARVTDPKLPQLTMKEPTGDRTFSWRLLPEESESGVIDTLARFSGKSQRVIREQIDALLSSMPRRESQSAWLYTPAARMEELGPLLPENADLRQVDIEGNAPSRERIIIIQGPTKDQEHHAFGQLVGRLQAALNLTDTHDGTLMAALIEEYGEAIGYRTAERDYRTYQMALDAKAVDTFCVGLAARLSAANIPTTAVDLEQALTRARRIADKEWANATRKDPIPIVEDIPHRVAVTLEGLGAGVTRSLQRHYVETAADLPGLRIVNDIGREYPEPGVASHLIGYLGKLSQIYDHNAALSLGLDPQGWLGRSGLEQRYDEHLQGGNGRRVRFRTPTGYRLVEERNPRAGDDLTLTLDLDLQRTAEHAVDTWLELAEDLNIATDKMRAAHPINKGRGAAVLMDVHTGAILACASRPGFDLRTFRKDFHDLMDPDKHPGRPLQDNATFAAHPPGSTVKPLMAMFGLAFGKIQPNTSIYSKGYMRIYRGRPIMREHQPFTPRDFNIATSIQKSSNVFYATVAEWIGGDEMSGAYARVGFGRRNSVDMDWQRPGLLPSPTNIKTLRPKEPTWYDSDNWRMGIGQFMSVSPLQLVVVPALVANGGKVIAPHIAQGAAQPPVAQIKLSAAGMHEVKRGMEMVTETGGTATKLKLESGHKVAAKTGTSEWGTRASRKEGLTPDHGWLIGYAPVQNPRVAFAIFVHSGTSGGRSSTGIAKAILDHYFKKYPSGH